MKNLSDRAPKMSVQLFGFFCLELESREVTPEHLLKVPQVDFGIDSIN